MSTTRNEEIVEAVVDTLVGLTQRKMFRSAWSLLQSNINLQDTRIHDAGIILQDLSNEYGDIGELDDCRLRKKLELKVNQVLKFLI